MLLALGAVVLPPLLKLSGLPILGSSYRPEYMIFELFGFSSSLALAVVALVEIRHRLKHGLAGVLPVLLFIVVSAHFATR